MVHIIRYSWYFAATILLLAAPLSSRVIADQQRRVAVLHFTAVSCGPCGGAALAMERLKAEAGDSLCVIGVHYYDLYKIPEAESLAAHYSVIGTPTSWFDGIFDQYYADTATYWGYRDAFDKRKVVEPGAALSLGGWADTTERIGQLTCNFYNPSAETLEAVLRTAVVERAIYRPWGGGDSVYDVLRGMLPGFDGPELRLAPGADTSFSFPFQIAPDWNAGQLLFTAWAEKPWQGKAPGAGSIVQSARIGIGQLSGVNANPPPGPITKGRLSAAIYPNPLKGRGTILFSLTKPGRVTASFYDIAGRRLGEMDLGWREAGEHRVELEAKYRRGQGWPLGIVICRVDFCGQSHSVKITTIN